MIKIIKKLLSGNTEHLNRKIKIFSHHYNSEMVSSFNAGYKKGVEEAEIKFNKIHNELYARCNYELESNLEELELPPAETVNIGSQINIMGNVEYIKKVLPEIGISVKCTPTGHMVKPFLVKFN